MKPEINEKNTDALLSEKVTSLSAEIHGLSCPTCSSRAYVKNGKEKGNQRYKCSRCGKHFRNTTGNTIHHLHLKPKIQAYLDCMNEGLSLRKTAKRINISVRTAFRWRHRFLSAMNKQPREELCSGKTISAFTLPFSSKQPRSKLTRHLLVNSVTQRSNPRDINPFGGANKSNKEIDYKPPMVTSVVQSDATGRVWVDVLGKYGTSSERIALNIGTKTVHIASKRLPKVLKQKSHKGLANEQLKNTQLIHHELASWLNHFRGVSTKYLRNYWLWFTHIWQLQISRNHLRVMMSKCL